MLSRKEIMLLKDKDKAFEAIAKHDDWSNHRKAAERSSWKKKHVPETVKKCPNRGKRYKTKPCLPKQESFRKQEPPLKVEEELEDPCQLCGQSADLYDFPCGHFICPPCFQKACTETNGRMTCQICKKLFIFDRELED